MIWAYSFDERAFKELRKLGSTPGMWMNLPLDYEFMRGDREKSPPMNSSHVNPRGLTPSWRLTRFCVNGNFFTNV